MKGTNEQSWVTVVLGEKDGWSAMVLAQSLRSVLTTRKLIVLIGENVSVEMRYFLGQFFDLVQLTSLQELDKISPELASLIAWKKCVYLPSNSFLVENSDELFDYNVMMMGTSGIEVPFDGSKIFVFKPTMASDDDSELERGNGIGQFLQGIQVVSDYFNSNCLWPKENVPRPKIVRIFPSAEGQGYQGDEYELWKMGLTAKCYHTFLYSILPQLRKLKATWIPDYIETSIRNCGTWSMDYMNLSNDDENLTNHSTNETEALENSIAVIGMASRFPGANTLDEYWDLMINGKYTVRRFPEDRMTFDIYGIEESVAGYLSCPIDAFDAEFFNINPTEAALIDPQHRLLLEVAWEALEDAGIDATQLRGKRGGVFLGILLEDYERLLPENDEAFGIDPAMKYISNLRSGVSGRLSHFLGLTGPSLPHEAGCSSGLGALHLACESLLQGECELAFSGAVNLVIIQRAYNTAVLSSDFKCKSFDESADGFVSGEACGTLLLKRYADAVRDGDRIRAVIRGTAMSNDGASLCYGTPNPVAHARTHKLALKKAGLAPTEVQYVESHGTGTQKGDIGEVFGLYEAYGRDRKSPLIIGSVKPNIGHGEAAAAVGSVVKVILALQREAIPPNIFLNKLNPKFNLDTIPAVMPTQLIPWSGDRRIAAVSSFSLTGSLVHAIFQSTPPIISTPIGHLNNLVQLITISAKNYTALTTQISNYAEFLSNDPSLALTDVAYAANACRTSFSHRIAIVATSMDKLINRLIKLKMSNDSCGGIAPSQPPKIGFVFTSSGIKQEKMIVEMCKYLPQFNRHMEYADAVYFEITGKKFLGKLFDETEPENYPMIIFSIQVAQAKLWKELGVEPNFVIGQGLGELSAAVISGILSFNDAIKMIGMDSNQNLHKIVSPETEITIGCPSCTYISATVGRELKNADLSLTHWLQVMGQKQDELSFSLVATMPEEPFVLIQMNILTSLLKSNDLKDKFVFPLSKPNTESWEAFYETLAELYMGGVDFDWNRWYGNRQKKVTLPFYPFQKQRYWFNATEQRASQLANVKNH